MIFSWRGCDRGFERVWFWDWCRRGKFRGCLRLSRHFWRSEWTCLGGVPVVFFVEVWFTFGVWRVDGFWVGWSQMSWGVCWFEVWVWFIFFRQVFPWVDPNQNLHTSHWLGICVNQHLWCYFNWPKVLDNHQTNHHHCSDCLGYARDRFGRRFLQWL